MADLAFAEESFFETPPDLAEELANLVLPFVLPKAGVKIVDACAGKGALGEAIANAAGCSSSISFIESNAELFRLAINNNKHRAAAPKTPLDVFSPSAMDILQAADVVVMNPPFAGIRGEPLKPALVELQDSIGYPDIGCQFILHVAKQLPPDSPLAFIFRRNAFYSRAYQRFWADLSAIGSLVEFQDVQRRLKPRSGAAEAVMGVFIRGRSNHRCWLQERVKSDQISQSKFLRLGWRRLGSVARVLAGPSIRNELKTVSGHHSASKVKVIEIPSGHDGTVLWGPDFCIEMSWVAHDFSVPRNLSYQGREGFVYKLAASEFRTAILPNGFHFISATPAVLPRRPYDLNFLIGCSLMPSWRQLVRETVGSSNFTPGSVEEVFVPYSSLHLYRELSKIGQYARCMVKHAVRRRIQPHCELSNELAVSIQKADDALSIEIG